MNKKTKRARFYASERERRTLDAIHENHEKNRRTTGYVGAVTGLTLRFTDGRIVKVGMGALFIGDR